MWHLNKDQSNEQKSANAEGKSGRGELFNQKELSSESPGEKPAAKILKKANVGTRRGTVELEASRKQASRKCHAQRAGYDDTMFLICLGHCGAH